MYIFNIFDKCGSLPVGKTHKDGLQGKCGQQTLRGQKIVRCKGIQQGVQIVLVVLDLAAKTPQGFCKAAYSRQTLNYQHGQNAQRRPPQQITVIDSFEQIPEGKVYGDAL